MATKYSSAALGCFAVVLLLEALPATVLGQQPCLRWFEVKSAGSPGPRLGHAMAYDSDRGVTVMFGGGPSDQFPTDNETWEYDGAVWKTIPITGARPSPRAGHAMAYDRARKQVVLFGGADGVGNRETWVYESDGLTATWTRHYPDPAPIFDDTWRCDGGMYGHSMAYHSARRTVVLQGGAQRCDSAEEFTGYYLRVTPWTWEWNGLAWTRGGGDSGERSGGAMAYDQLRGVAVLFGGDGCDSSSNCHTDNHFLQTGTWEYNGTWAAVSGSTPTLRWGHAMAYDSRRNKVVMFGGCCGGLADDTDEYTSGVGWTSSLDGGPPPRYWHAMVYDNRRGVMVVYGGKPANAAFGTYDDTWELDVCTRPPETVRWVDFAYRGQDEFGSFTAPFNTLAEGVASVPVGGTLRIKAGTSTERPILSKAMTISAYGGPVTIGQ